MLNPLTSFVGEFDHTKVTQAKMTNKAKRTLWHWDKVHQTTYDDVKAIITTDVALAYLNAPKNLKFKLSLHQNRGVL